MIDELPLTEGHRAPPPPPTPADPRPASRAASSSWGPIDSLRSWLVDEVLLSCYRALIAKLNAWQWSDAGNVFLDEKATATPGYYASAKTPYVREFMETYTSPEWDEDHVMKSSRVGITEAALCIVRYMPENAPGQALIALDSTEEAKKVAADRLIPTLPAASLTDDDDDVTRKIIRLRNMVIHIAGSYSPTIFRNKWLRLAFLDEVEVVEEIAEEGTLHDLARSRQTDVPGAKLFSASKPKKWRSKHHCEVVTGTLSCLLVECPHCGTWQELSFGGDSPTYSLRIEDSLRAGEPALSPPLGLYDAATGRHLTPPPPRLGRFRFDHCKDLLGQWDLTRIERETFYECASESRCAISNAEIKAAIAPQSIRWLKTNPRHVPRKRSRHIWDVHSPHEKLSLGYLARQFVEAQSDPAKLLHVFNNHFGLPWREKRAVIGDLQLLHCREAYQRGTVPFPLLDPQLVTDIGTTCADSQDDCWKFVTTAYRITWRAADSAAVAGWERAVVRWGRAGTRVELIEEGRTPMPYAVEALGRERRLTPHSGFVDLGGSRSDEVYDLHAESWGKHSPRPFFYPILGRGWQTKGRIWYSENAEHKGRKVRVFFCDDDSFKRSLYLGSIAQAAEIKRAIADGFIPTAIGRPARLWIPGLPGDGQLRELLDELQAEQIGPDSKWRKLRGQANDYGDALKYCDAWFEFMLPHLVKARIAELAQKGPPAPSSPPSPLSPPSPTSV